MRESPRIRRLRNDYKSMERLRGESSILDFDSTGEPADKYVVRFYGKGLFRPSNSNSVLLRELHEVRIVLGASYPRMMPELNWVSPVYHPNISASGVVCLGGYGTHWVPSLSLDELCEMLWDMIRYQNFDVESPYNRDAASWARHQTTYVLPVDARSLRDRVRENRPGSNRHAAVLPPPALGDDPPDDVVILEDVVSDDVLLDDQDDEIIDAELVDAQDQDEDIVFLD